MAFKEILSAQAISDVAIYVMTLEGSPVDNGKAPEGKSYPPAYTYYQNSDDEAENSNSGSSSGESFYSPL